MAEFLQIGERNSTPGAAFSRDNVLRFQTPCRSKALWQLANSVVPYVLLWIAMVYALQVSYWLVVPLAILAAGFLARIFIIFHDCGHSSFFKSKRANRVTGTIAAFLNLTPYRHWRWQHALHHGTSGNLDRRGAGDIWTLTVQEYYDGTRWKRAAYRLVRNPLVLFMIAPLYVFVVHHRFVAETAPARERQSVHRTNWALLAVTVLMSVFIGLKAFLLIQLTVSAIAGALGLWLFYVQHQFEGAYWARGKEWDYTAATDLLAFGISQRHRRSTAEAHHQIRPLARAHGPMARYSRLRADPDNPPIDASSAAARQGTRTKMRPRCVR